MAEHYCITITRQFGSLGRKIGKRVAEKMGFNYYDRDIIEQASPLVGKNIEQLAKYDGHYFGGIFNKMMYPLGYGSASTQKKLFEVEKSIILEHAEYENCVIIGRCADDILKEKKKHFSVFIFAPFGQRLKNCTQELNLSEEEALNYMCNVDRAREEFYSMVTKERFDSIVNRQLLIDSSLLGIEGTADLIVMIAKEKFGIA